MQMVDAKILAEIIPPTKLATWELNTNGRWSRWCGEADDPNVFADRVARLDAGDVLHIELPGTYGWVDEADDSGTYNEEDDTWEPWSSFDPWKATDYFPGRYDEWQEWIIKAEDGSPRDAEEALVVEVGTQIPQALVDEVRAFIHART